MNIYKILNIATRCLCLGLIAIAQVAQAEIKLADKPLFTSYAVPGNVALVLSVEYPTALGAAYTDNSPDATYPDTSYSPSTDYLGYFDQNKCYDYNTSTPYFVPKGPAKVHICSGQWSGNFLNWALTQTIDPMRQILTGGYRVFDYENLTVLEKAWFSGQQAYRTKKLNNQSDISGATPFTNKKSFSINLLSGAQGNQFTHDGDSPSTSPSTMYARVQVCASEALKESNCTTYPNGKLKPTGLIQKNATKMNFGAFGYGLDLSLDRQGGGTSCKNGGYRPYSC